MTETTHLNLKPLPANGERLSFALVYQAGIANVFRIDCANLEVFGRNAQRIYQGDFRTAEAIAFGLGMAGAIVHTMACNRAGDIIDATWTDDLESQPFSVNFSPVFFTIGI
jgi:hypothetical protein